MLTRQTVLGEGACIESVPTIGFVTTEDGRTLVALTEHDDSLLEIMAAPMTLITQNPATTAPVFKSIDGNLILNPPVFQINVEGMSSNGVQRTLLLPTQPIDTGCNILEQPQSIQQGAPTLAGDFSTFGLENATEININVQDSASAVTNKSVQKKTPGRPKKNELKECLKCDICDREFTKQSLYRKHMDHHAEEKPHRCPKCPASFNIPSNFTLHMATHNTGDPKCPECGRKFARMASLKSHMIHHEKEENLFCTECEDAFATKAQLDAHLKLHGEKWSSDEARKCKLCNKQFTQPALYRLHIREHYRLQTRVTKQTKRGAKHKTMYKCTICLKSFQKPSQLMRHIRVHTGEKPFKCTICGRAFTQKSSLQIHTWQHNGIRPHTCELCNAKFSQKGNLNAHILRVHNAPEGEPIYACTYCSCVFKKLGSLNGHIKRMHTNMNGETVERNEEMLTEADMRATVDSVISQLASLESTTNPGINATPNPTVVTNSNTASIINLENGNSTIIVLRDDILQQALDKSGLSPKKNAATPQTKVEARTNFVTLLDRSPDGGTGKYLTIKQRCIGNVRWYACSFCHKEFKKPSDLIRHLRVHTQEKPFKCTHCFRSFALKSTMIAHERTHTGTKKYACSSCEKTFACYGSLVAHTRAHHGDKNGSSEGGGKCSDSSKSQTKSSKSKSKLSPEAENLAQDLVLQEPLVISDLGNRICVAQVASKQKQVYDEKSDVARPHKCWVCHAAFRKISHLKQHYRRHTGERPYKCTKCDRRFTSNSVLKSHLHTHEDLRPFSCSVCDTKFSTQSSMKRHLVTHSTRRPFMCPYCHKTFKTYVNCRKHMKIHKHELAQRQLEQQKTQDEGGQEITLNVEVSTAPSVLSENLGLSEEMDMSFQPRIENVFSQNLSDHLQDIVEPKDKSVLTTNRVDAAMNTHIAENLHDVDTTAVTNSQMLHADERGAVTLPGYSGDQTLTPESIREIEETLNQQLFNIGMNLGLGANLSRQIDESNATALDTSRDQPTLTVPYETTKDIETAPSNVFTSQFDSFDMSQITLQPDVEIDIGLVDAANTTSMASILPKSAKEEERLIAVTSVTSEPQTPNVKTSVAVSTLTEDTHETLSLQENGTNPTNEVPMPLAASVPKAQSDTQEASPSEHTNSNGNESTKLSESLLQCHLCSKRGFTTGGLKEHLKMHRSTKEFQCLECPLRFYTYGGLNRHSKMHVNKPPWECPICHKIAASKSELKLHSKEHEDTLALSSQDENIEIEESVSELAPVSPSNEAEVEPDSSISEKVLMDAVAEKEVMERLNCIPEKKEQKEYTNRCRYCPKTFRKPSDLIRHTRTHTGERPYKCDFCSKSFAVKCTLDSHIKVHTGKRTFRCHVCSSLFATKGSLKVHMRLHTGSKPFRCPICDLRFRTSGHRKVHLLKHTRQSKGSNPKRKPKNFKVTAVAEAAAAALEKSKDCIEKIVSLPAEQQLESGENADYSNLQEVIGIEDLTGQITFSTEGAILNNNSVLSVNESNQIVANLQFLLANGLVTIQTDDTPLLSQNTAPEATGIISNDTVTFAVSVAGPEPSTHIATANNSIQLTTIAQPITIPSISLLHVTKVPGKPERPAAKEATKSNFSKKECDICGKTFMKPYQVERHKRIHTGERPYKCDLCTKSFAQKSTLQMHQKHHTGDRPHHCPHCEYSFTQKGNLRTHVKRVHRLDTLDIKKLRRSRQNFAPKPIQVAVPEAKILTFDDISFVELLK